MRPAAWQLRGCVGFGTYVRVVVVFLARPTLLDVSQTVSDPLYWANTVCSVRLPECCLGRCHVVHIRADQYQLCSGCLSAATQELQAAGGRETTQFLLFLLTHAQGWSQECKLQGELLSPICFIMVYTVINYRNKHWFSTMFGRVKKNYRVEKAWAKKWVCFLSCVLPWP